METAAFSLFIVALLHFISKMPIAMAQSNVDEDGYDNNHPRAQQARLTGFGQRALAAHQNGIEAFPIFAAAVLIALYAKVDMATIEIESMLFVACRVVYLVLYWANIALIRSLVWAAGYIICLHLMLSPLLMG